MTKLMGIINATPDSFFEKSRIQKIDEAVLKALEFANNGADIIDIGGASSRPGAPTVSVEEEYKRVIPLINAISKVCPYPISIDTFHPEVVEGALEAGASYINDIYGFENEKMRKLAAEHACPIIVMHMQGTPATMQINPHYPEGIISHLVHWFEERIELLLAAGVKENNIILDPGIGFGKTIAHNIEILKNISELKVLNFKLLIGISRKSFMQKLLNKSAGDLLAATLTINSMLIDQGVDIIRVHDISEHRDLIKLQNILK